MVVDPTPPSVRKKEPHEILTGEVKQLSSVDQLLDADLTWLHMRPLYDRRAVDKRAESPTLVKGLAKTLKDLEINSPVSGDRKDVAKDFYDTPSTLPDSLKRRSSAMISASQPLRVMMVTPGEEFTVDEYGQPTLGTMDNLYIGTLEKQPEDDSDKLKMEIDQFKIPGKKTLAPPLKRRGTVGVVSTAEAPTGVTLKSPTGHVPDYSYVRGTAGQMPQYGYSMFGAPAGDDYDSDDDYVTIDRPEDMSNEMLDAYIGEVNRTGAPGKAGAKGNPVEVADNILLYGLHPIHSDRFGLYNGHNPSLTPATSVGSLRSRQLSRADSENDGPLSDAGSLGNLAWNRGPAGSAFGGSSSLLTPGSNLNINLSQQSPGSVGYPGSGYGPGTGASTPVTPGTPDGRSPGLHRASVYLPQQEVPGANGMYGSGYNGFDSIAESQDDLSKKDCFLCKERLQDVNRKAIITTNDGHWHEECFVCVQCFQPFKDPNDPSQESVFYEHEDRPYCHNCYTVNFAPMCFTCGGWVIGRVIEALDVKWHPECFGCYMCGAELCENGFFKHNGRPICIDCHDLLKKKKKYICNKCFTPIEEFVLWYLKESYHPYHFSCQNCYKPLDNKYKEKDNQFYCQLCFDTVIQDVCAACKKAIDGRAIKAASKAWCPEHFLCYQCERPLSGDKFMLNEGKPYCQYHYMKMFGVRCFYCDNRSSMQVIKVLNKNYCENHFFCTGCDTLLEEKKSKVIEMDMKPYCRHCYDKFPSDMRRKLLDSANMTAKSKKQTMKKDKKGSMKKPKKEKKADNREITNATETAS
ncbi:LIM domain-containing protein B-like isoform X2 [Bolinopsis microptera]|uniref:LIM domain-containing protein B-like isoform X2 n=1 Tax=Bolinopsis microptera TaxID=2820187 RepID=UPI00307992F9